MEKQIRSAISNALNRIVSRNFDINGYWGMGIVIRDMKNSGLHYWIFESGSSTQNSSCASFPINNIINDQLAKAGVGWIVEYAGLKTSLRISLCGGDVICESECDFNIEISAVLDGKRLRSYNKLIKAWPHDKNKERQSCRPTSGCTGAADAAR